MRNDFNRKITTHKFSAINQCPSCCKNSLLVNCYLKKINVLEYLSNFCDQTPCLAEIYTQLFCNIHSIVNVGALK